MIDSGATMDPEQYCRDIEAHLCRKNDGHLIRIVGPAFERVSAWSSRGIPLSVACRGIDRYFERYYAKGPRRRPVRIEFCEADVLDTFDQWRRAVGVTGIGPGAADREPASHGQRHGGLPAHLEKAVARLTARRSGDARGIDAALEAIVRELDAARPNAKSLRGDARHRFLERLRVLDRALLDAARAAYDAEVLAALTAEAEAELLPFRDRMPRDAYARSLGACVDRLLRERERLPTLAFE